MQRTTIIAGNWKMNKTPGEAVELAGALKERLGTTTDPEIVVCPSFTALVPVAEVLADTAIRLGAQNMHPAPEGAYTGETSAGMLLAAGCRDVILGHSERRHGFGEDDAFVNAKTLAALEAGLRPIVCVGETLEEREKGATFDVVLGQVEGSLRDVPPERAASLVVAYEPVWAIGTGRTATPEQAQEVHAAIRGRIGEIFGEEVAGAMRILYGGSVKPENAAELLGQADIDGALVGGASLKADAFAAIADAAR